MLGRIPCDTEERRGNCVSWANAWHILRLQNLARRCVQNFTVEDMEYHAKWLLNKKVLKHTVKVRDFSMSSSTRC